ncbi:unnamed protein product [Eruca vesicaria subsp. sativa]|uniref:N-acetyltransferase domain-containing protein n=1 Tax=Eruca vesicaria subsp. sativa TaxID=29727 RepID=A0ABC8L0P4_ERUVS|nr:unnamed protein product [Eruca vesicaria subsp. sativa]
MVDFPQVLRMEIGSPNAGLLYSRLVPLVLLFVDGNHTPFSLMASRMFIVSLILVLPSFQGKGYGSYLMEVVSKMAVAENAYDLTVEEPSEKFQHIRICIDINRLLSFDPIKPAINSAVESLTKVNLSKKADPPCNKLSSWNIL